MSRAQSQIDPSRARFSAARRLALLLGAAIAALGFSSSTALAAAPVLELHPVIPDSAEAGALTTWSITVENVGDAPLSGGLTFTLQYAPGLTAVAPEEAYTAPEGTTCGVSGQTLTCTIPVDGWLPGAEGRLLLKPQVESGAEGDLVSTTTVTGGGSAEGVSESPAIAVAPPNPFAFQTFRQLATNPDATLSVQAGSSPGQIVNGFKVRSFSNNGFPLFPVNSPVEQFRTVLAHLPPGLVANLGATSSRCTAEQLVTQSPDLVQEFPACPYDSQVGMAGIDFGTTGRFTAPVYNMVPSPGVAAEFGFAYAFVPILLEARIRPGDYGFDIKVRNVSSTLPLVGNELTMWGVPDDSSHDTLRGLCTAGAQGNTQSQGNKGVCTLPEPHRRAFLRLPTSCSGPLPWTQEVDSYQHPGTFIKTQTTTPAQTGCNQLDFTPSFTAKPTTNLGDSPAGLELKLHLPQNEDPDGLAEAHLKDLRMALPTGLVVNSASADGLGSCSPAQIGLQTAVGQLPARFDGAPSQCPASSKLGSVVVNAPALGHNLPGSVFLASQNQNPFGSLLALYLVIDDPASGIRVKIPTKVIPDPVTGQLTTLVQDGPQLPFEDLEVQLDKGPHASLRTPINCGNFTSSSDMTPWSAPEGQDAHPSDSFAIVKGAGGGACVGNEGVAAKDPSFEAGTLEPKAGAYSPFVLKLTRGDGTQQLTGVDATLPKGLIGRLAGSSYCPEEALQEAAAKSGKAEQASPSCPASSEVGVVNVAVGAGPAPLHVSGRAYLTGPYKGAQLGLAVITPALAGPFDLGTVVIRNQLRIDPETTQVRAVSDPIPHILQGLPLDIRQVTVELAKPQFTLNPTSCDPTSVTGAASLLTGQSAALTSPFQVGGCTELAFKPRLALSLKGPTTRGQNPALSATLTFPKAKGANIAKVSVALPHSEFLDQSHIGTVCTRVQFAASQCPVRSVYGKAKATSPLLDAPLAGPVYLRSSSHTLPDLVADLRGQLHVVLAGRIDTDKKGGIRTTFESVPDAPVTKFTLQMQGGKKGLLQNSTNLCKAANKATVLFDAQNGKTADLAPELQVGCAKGLKAHKKHGR